MIRLASLLLSILFIVLPTDGENVGEPFSVIVKTNNKRTAWRTVLKHYPLDRYSIILAPKHWKAQ